MKNIYWMVVLDRILNNLRFYLVSGLAVPVAMLSDLGAIFFGWFKDVNARLIGVFAWFKDVNVRLMGVFAWFKDVNARLIGVFAWLKDVNVRLMGDVIYDLRFVIYDCGFLHRFVGLVGMRKWLSGFVGMTKWIPAFAGMTKIAGMAKIPEMTKIAGMTKWVPAFAGMTKMDFVPVLCGYEESRQKAVGCWYGRY